MFNWSREEVVGRKKEKKILESEINETDEKINLEAACEDSVPVAEQQSDTVAEQPNETVSEEKKKGILNIKLFNYKLVHILIMVIIMSFAGFVVENIFRFLRDGVINSRRQILPFLFAYGIAVFVLYIVVGTPKEMRFFKWKLFRKNNKLSKFGKDFCYFLILFAFIFFGEIMFGTFVEAVSGIVLWDYTGIPLRFTKYTSIPTALLLAVGLLLFMRFVFEPLMRKIEKIPEKVAWIIDLALGIPIVLDWLLMLVLMLGFQYSENWWMIDFHFKLFG